MSRSLPGWRLRLITLLDAAVVVTASAALVILLGGRTRLITDSVRISLRAPGNLAEIAAAILLVRLLLFGLVRALPAVAATTIAFDEERRYLQVSSAVTRRVLWYAVAALLGSLLWELPHLIHLRRVPDPYDPVFSAWRLAALAHQLATDPRHLWDANIFYPLPLALTYSDATVLQGLLAAPFVWAGVDPLLVANAMMVISYPARGLAFFVLAWRLTDDPQVALLTALLGAWSPFYPQHYSQLEMQWTMFVPVVVLLFLQVLAAPRWRTGVLLGAAMGAQSLSCMYVAVMLATWLIPFAGLMALAWRPRLSKQLLTALGAAAIVPGTIAVLFGASYTRARAVHGDWSPDVVRPLSAVPRDYGDAQSWLTTYKWQSRRNHHNERELFPGSSTLAAAGVALVPPLSSVSIAAVVSGALAFDWSLGFNGLSYDDLRHRLSPYRAIRVPARFAVLVDTSLVILGIFGVRRLLRAAHGQRRAIVCGVLAAAVLLDLRIEPRLQDYPTDVPGIYRSVTPDMVLAELPRKDHTIDYMYFSTKHWAHLLGGYSGFFPPLQDFDRASHAFPSAEAVATFHTLGATHLTYNCSFDYDYRCRPVLEELDANPTLALVARGNWRGAEVRLYRYR